MLQVLAKQEYLRMEDGLQQVAKNQTDPFKRMTAAMRLIRDSLNELSKLLEEHPFEDKKEEAHFFKFTKPQFYAHYIFEVALFNLRSGLPGGDVEQLRAHYLDELRFIQRELRQHAFLYQYYRLGADDLDELYFVRGVEVQSVLIPEVPELDKTFSTSGDYLFAKFKAFEMLQEHIAHALANIGKPERTVYLRPGGRRQPLKWTGEQINAVELGYGLWVSEQLNGGEAALADIMYWLSESLDVDLSKHTTRFEEIKERKILSPTRFFDGVRESVRRYIDDLNGLQPMKRRRAKRSNTRSKQS
ncbi:RteC domain-containing protein [Mucilaginibacter paludis]|uniref:Tetracycline regulation of excision, RteC n=1 Tax=Mucilaginibacter paludis DSM 18603 TaxID=714943 RepID=H1YIA4_9SPHI|nr:RteC domain-containing protein [Mucilaginibacter paludis]EHQ27517.1 Tetracycline regulation of excision, RteC [Mucilaginibacter paludis DSM 18603]